MMIEVPLTQGYVALVDDEDKEQVLAFKWYAARTAWGVYATRAERDPSTGKTLRIPMHRSIMGAQAGQYVDHINHDGLDNRRGNLRLCTNSENQCNARKQKRHTSSTYKGVYWCREKSKWHAQIKRNGHKFHLGYFGSETEAARAYNNAAQDRFGEFALINDL